MFHFISDETASQNHKNAHDTIRYKVRRLGTDSSLNIDVDHPYATEWRWYWQDSFGMWRYFPLNKSDVIDSNITCLSDDIEAKYLEFKYDEGEWDAFFSFWSEVKFLFWKIQNEIPKISRILKEIAKIP